MVIYILIRIFYLQINFPKFILLFEISIMILSYLNLILEIQLLRLPSVLQNIILMIYQELTMLNLYLQFFLFSTYIDKVHLVMLRSLKHYINHVIFEQIHPYEAFLKNHIEILFLMKSYFLAQLSLQDL